MAQLGLCENLEVLEFTDFFLETDALDCGLLAQGQQQLEVKLILQLVR